MPINPSCPPASRLPIVKAAAAEIWRQGVLETTKHLQEQTRLKGIAAKADQERERRITKEYEEMCDRQDAERTAKLKERCLPGLGFV